MIMMMLKMIMMMVKMMMMIKMMMNSDLNLIQEFWWYNKPRFRPHDVEVAAELHAVLLVLDGQHVNDVDPNVNDIGLSEREGCSG